MSKFGLYSDKSTTAAAAIPFESHLEGLEEEETKTSLLDLRNFVKSLGNNVIEEVRPHRITYAKSLTFRTFLDIQPKKDSLTISVRRSRNEPATNHIVKTVEDIENVKPQITEAYEKVK
jgi:predicted transport protein